MLGLYYIADGFGPVCEVCTVAHQNSMTFDYLHKMFGDIFAERLPADPGALVVEFLYGDGRERDCECGHCRRSWSDRGWLCPQLWQREVDRRRLAWRLFRLLLY